MLSKVVVLKHADSVDRAYKTNWIDLYNADGERVFEPPVEESTKLSSVNDAGLQLQLPPRAAEKDSWLADPPLSVIGWLTATEMGKRMKTIGGYTADQIGNCIYSSPCLCCIETAKHLAIGMEETKLQIRVEPSLANWHSQHRFLPPTWTVQTAEWYSTVASIDLAYKPTMQGSVWKAMESLSELVARTKVFLDALADQHTATVALLIGHGCTLFAADRALCPRRPNLPKPLSWVTYFRQVPRLASVRFDKTDNNWTYKESDIPQFCHMPNARGNWQNFHKE